MHLRLGPMYNGTNDELRELTIELESLNARIWEVRAERGIAQGQIYVVDSQDDELVELMRRTQENERKFGEWIQAAKMRWALEDSGS